MQPKPLKFMGSSREGKSLGDVTTASGVNERSNNSIRRNRNVKYIKVTSDVLNLICAAASWWLRSIKKKKNSRIDSILRCAASHANYSNFSAT